MSDDLRARAEALAKDLPLGQWCLEPDVRTIHKHIRAVVEAERESLLALLERCIEVMEFAYMNAAEQPREIEEARAAIRARKP